MYSMTGYGKGEYREGGIELTVELKSVNNRFLDIAIKSPCAFNAFEEEVRARIRRKLSRGHVDVFVSYADKREKAKTLYVDLSAAHAYVDAAEKLKKEFPSLNDDTTISQLLRSPDITRTEDVQEEDTALQSALFVALDLAIDALKKMRLSEGERLKADVLSRVETIGSLRDAIATRAPLVAEEYRKKLTERMQDFLSGKVDETRILTEAAIFADKSNIDEELTRLQSHIAEFCNICKGDEVGRRLDFLVQEFNRECNTVCSKSSDAQITADALKMKNEIEKIREQIQNLE